MRRSPRREFAHKRTCRRVFTDHDLAHAVIIALVIAVDIRQSVACVHINRHRRAGIVNLAEIHSNHTCHVVINDYRRRAHFHRHFHFILESVVAALNQGDSLVAACVRLREQPLRLRGIIGSSTRAGNNYVFERLTIFLIAEHTPCEIVFFAVFIARFFVERRRFVFVQNTVAVAIAEHIGRLLPTNTRHRQSGSKSRRRAYRARIGVGRKVRTERAAVACAIIVGSRAYKTDPCRLNTFINGV